MSQELINIRRALSKVSTDLKQGQLISAATAIRDGARLFGRVPMMKNEHEEFVNLLQTAINHMQYNKRIAEIFPLSITYKPGEESVLGDVMNQLIETLQEVSTEEALEKHREHKAAQLERARAELREKNIDGARATLKELHGEYPKDVDLMVEIAECFMQANLFDEALPLLEGASSLDPNSASTYNRLGVVQRKLKRYVDSERNFNKALSLDPKDPNLYFNLGRLYLDQGLWPQVKDCAEKALALAPEFAEAAKMAAYADKKAAGN